MASFWVPPLLGAAAPQAKILVLLRDPVDLWVSGLTHRRRLEPVLDWRGAVEAFSRGRYLEQLTWLRQYFPAERLLVLQYERCRRDTSAQLNRTLSFLGCPGPGALDGIEHPVNPSDQPKAALPTNVRRQLVRRYTDEVSALANAYPDIDLALWPHFAHLA